MFAQPAIDPSTHRLFFLGGIGSLVDAAFDPITRTIYFGSGNTTAGTTALIVMMIAIAAVAIRRVS